MTAMDLYATLRYLSKADVQRTTGEHGEPGWYVRAYSNEGYQDHQKWKRVSHEHARAIAVTIDRACGTEHQFTANAVDAIQRRHREQATARRLIAERQIQEAQATLAALDAEEGRAGQGSRRATSLTGPAGPVDSSPSSRSSAPPSTAGGSPA